MNQLLNPEGEELREVAVLDEPSLVSGVFDFKIGFPIIKGMKNPIDTSRKGVERDSDFIDFIS